MIACTATCGVSGVGLGVPEDVLLRPRGSATYLGASSSAPPICGVLHRLSLEPAASVDAGHIAASISDTTDCAPRYPQRLTRRKVAMERMQ